MEPSSESERAFPTRHWTTEGRSQLSSELYDDRAEKEGLTLGRSFLGDLSLLLVLISSLVSESVVGLIEKS